MPKIEKDSNSKKLVPVLLQRLFLERTDETHYIRMADMKEYLEKNGVPADRRTIGSAIDILTIAGFDIQGQQEKGNYKYHLVGRDFDRKELKYLIDAVASSRFLTAKEAGILIEKIKGLGIEADRPYYNRGVLLGNRIERMNDAVFNSLDKVYQAIADNRQISFQYMRWSKERKLEKYGKRLTRSPLAVSFNDNNYYLIAYDSRQKTLRHYRIDKMKDIERLADAREGLDLIAHFSPTDYARKTFGMFDGEETGITIEAHNSLAGVFIERFGEDVRIYPAFGKEHYFQARFTAKVSPQFYGWLFGLGEKVEIISPAGVREAYAEMLAGVLARYSP